VEYIVDVCAQLSNDQGANRDGRPHKSGDKMQISGFGFPTAAASVNKEASMRQGRRSKMQIVRVQAELYVLGS